MAQCGFNAQGKFNCMEQFVDAPPDYKYSIQVMVILGRSIIFNKLYEEISPKESDTIAKISSQWDQGNGMHSAGVRITDNTMYEVAPQTPPLKLWIKTNDRLFPVDFIGNLDTKSTAGRLKRSAEFTLDRYSGLEVMFNRK